MVKKIRKISKKGPKASYAVPLVVAFSSLYGPRCVGRPFWQTFDDPGSIRTVFSRHLDASLLIADRILPIGEYLGWGLRSSPGKVGGMFGKSGVIPMGFAPVEENADSGDPRLGIFVMVALVKGENLDRFSNRLGMEFEEIDRVVFENSIGTAFQIIPGYDRVLYTPPLLAKSLNAGIDQLNQQIQEAFEKVTVSYPGPFEPFPSDLIASIPTHEPLQS